MTVTSVAPVTPGALIVRSVLFVKVNAPVDDEPDTKLAEFAGVERHRRPGEAEVRDGDAAGRGSVIVPPLVDSAW